MTLDGGEGILAELGGTDWCRLVLLSMLTQISPFRLLFDLYRTCTL